MKHTSLSNLTEVLVYDAAITGSVFLVGGWFLGSLVVPLGAWESNLKFLSTDSTCGHVPSGAVDCHRA